ncbi:hypothetical protein [Oceanospirillum beijerinckii]|uniref:hypothetical protein n=1 Tax=Oceanospirillum beijerinckii TaxID=64976 RepID=UPI0003FC92D0|nr:hypothetical protein [Oceanospirillum beijerinckii]
MKLHGKLVPLSTRSLSKERVDDLVFGIMDEEQELTFRQQRECKHPYECVALIYSFII